MYLVLATFNMGRSTPTLPIALVMSKPPYLPNISAFQPLPMAHKINLLYYGQAVDTYMTALTTGMAVIMHDLVTRFPMANNPCKLPGASP